MPFSNVYFLFFFLADMFAHEEGGPEPDWVKTERDQFSDFRDLNKDGKMDQEEIRQWILPKDYDHAQAEARHLVYESDLDKVHASFSRPVGVGGLAHRCLKVRLPSLGMEPGTWSTRPACPP